MALNFTTQYAQAKKKDPNLSLGDFRKKFEATASPEEKKAYETNIAKNKRLAEKIQQKRQKEFVQKGGKLKEGEVYDPYATLRGMAEQRARGEEVKPQETFKKEEATALRRRAGDTSFEYRKPERVDPSKLPSEPPKRPRFGEAETEEDRLRMEAAYNKQLADFHEQQSQARQQELGTVSKQVTSFGEQLQAQQQQVQDLINNLNTQRQGLGDQVSSVLDKIAASGAEGSLDEGMMSQIQQMAQDTPPEELEQKISQMISPPPSPEMAPAPPAPPEEPEAPAPMMAPPSVLTPSKNQQYNELKQSGMNAGQIIQQNPKLFNQVVPDGSILNNNAGVGLVQTPMGEAYKLPSGLMVPRDPSSGFYDLSKLPTDQVRQMNFYDVMALDLATQKTTSDMKAFYTASTLQSMGKRNQREYDIASVELDAFYNAETNRVNESKVIATQQIEIERMRQELSKDTSIQQLNDTKNKTSAILKAQMDAWGLEGSTAAMSAMSAHNLKFEQEAASIHKAYDVNIKELALASSQAEMQFANRVTEINQRMQVDKLKLENDYVNRRDELDRSVLLSQVEKMTEDANMYRDYAAQIYDHEQQTKAAAAEAEQAAREDIWERQKWYSDKMGMFVELDENGKPIPVLNENGEAMYTASHQEFLMGHSIDLEKLGLDKEKFEFDKEKFGLEYALDAQRVEIQSSQLNLDYNKFDLETEKYWNELSQYDIKWNEDQQTYIGTNKNTGAVVNLGNAGITTPENGRYDYSLGANSITFNVQEGSVVSERWQCGQFVNDALFGKGRGIFGDMYEQKMSKTNSENAVPGGAFVEKTRQQWGHVGIVEKVYPDGSFDIVESNYKKNKDGVGLISRTTITPGSARWTSIVEQGGFYDPNPNGPKGGGSGIFSKYIQEGLDMGMNPKEARGHAADRVSAISKDMTEGQSKTYVSFNTMREENSTYDSLLDGTNVTFEDFADAINVVNRRMKNDDVVAEVINRTMRDKPQIQAAMYSEMRWIEAVLRKQSGAAISAEEYKTYGTMYFPRAGDNRETLIAKKQARETVTQSFQDTLGAAGMSALEDRIDQSYQLPEMASVGGDDNLLDLI